MKLIITICALALLAGCEDELHRKSEPQRLLPPRVKQEYTVLEKTWSGKDSTSAYCILVLKDKNSIRFVTTAKLDHAVQEFEGKPYVPRPKADSPCVAVVGEKVTM